MNSTDDGRDLKSISPSGHKGKEYFIKLYKSLESRLSSKATGGERVRVLCEAWHHTPLLCQQSVPATQVHLISWIQTHTAGTLLQAEWQSPESAKHHVTLKNALEKVVRETRGAICHHGGGRAWQEQLVQIAEKFKQMVSDPWGHPVLRLLLNTEGDQPDNEQLLKWLSEEKGVILVARLRHMATSKCQDLALAVATEIMDRARASISVAGADKLSTATGRGDTSQREGNFSLRLSTEADFTLDVWNSLTDIELVLLHKSGKINRCEALVNQISLRNGCQLVNRLCGRLAAAPNEKRLWKNAKDMAKVAAGVIILRCMKEPWSKGLMPAALNYCVRALVQVSADGRLDDYALYVKEARTAHHLYTFTSAVQALCTEATRPFVCELFIHTITYGMNELEALKDKADKESETRAMEETLAEWFVEMGKLMKTSNRIYSECLLTAFSVHPSIAMYENLLTAPAPLKVDAVNEQSKEEEGPAPGSWANDSSQSTNFVKTSQTLNWKQATTSQANVLSAALFSEGESLGLSPELCNDLAAVLGGPRVKILSWDMDRMKLLENCQAYMERTSGGTKSLVTELKYLNLDPSSVQHLSEDIDEDENDAFYGIEKGYEHLVEFQDEPKDESQDVYQDHAKYLYISEGETTESAELSSYSDEFPRRVHKKKVRSSDYDSDPLSLTKERKLKSRQKEKSTQKSHNKERCRDRRKEPLTKEITLKNINEDEQELKMKSKSKENSTKTELEDFKCSLPSMVGMQVCALTGEPKNAEVKRKICKKKERRRQDKEHRKISKKSQKNITNIQDTRSSLTSMDTSNKETTRLEVVDGLYSMGELRSSSKHATPFSQTTTNNLVNSHELSATCSSLSINNNLNSKDKPLNMLTRSETNNTLISTKPDICNNTNIGQTLFDIERTNTTISNEVKRKLIEFRMNKIASKVDVSHGCKIIDPYNVVSNNDNTANLKELPKASLFANSNTTQNYILSRNNINDRNVCTSTYIAKCNPNLQVTKYAQTNTNTTEHTSAPIQGSAEYNIGATIHQSSISKNYSLKTATKDEENKTFVVISQCGNTCLNKNINLPKTAQDQTDVSTQNSPLQANRGKDQQVNSTCREMHKIPVATSNQNTIQNFVKELTQTINAGTTVVRNCAKNKSNLHTFQHKISPGTLNPQTLLSNSVNSSNFVKSSQCAKVSQKKVANVPNTFSRLSYMHKNKQEEINKSKQLLVEGSLPVATLNCPLDELTQQSANQKLQKYKYMPAQCQVQIHKTDKTTSPKLSPSLTELVDTPAPNSVTNKYIDALNTNSNIKFSMNCPTTAKDIKPAQSLKSVRPFQSTLSETNQMEFQRLLWQKNKLNANLIQQQKFNNGNTGMTGPTPSNSNVQHNMEHNVIVTNPLYKTLVNQNRQSAIVQNIQKSVPECLNQSTTKSHPTSTVDLQINQNTSVPVSNNYSLNHSNIQHSNKNNMQENNKSRCNNKICNKTKNATKLNNVNNSDMQQDWQSVLNELLSHQTPSRGDNALHLKLKSDHDREIAKAKFSTNALLNQRVMNLNTNNLVSSKKKCVRATHKTKKVIRPRSVSKIQSNLNNLNCMKPVDVTTASSTDCALLDEEIDKDLLREIDELTSDEEDYSDSRCKINCPNEKLTNDAKIDSKKSESEIGKLLQIRTNLSPLSKELIADSQVKQNKNEGNLLYKDSYTRSILMTSKELQYANSTIKSTVSLPYHSKVPTDINQQNNHIESEKATLLNDNKQKTDLSSKVKTQCSPKINILSSIEISSKDVQKMCKTTKIANNSSEKSRSLQLIRVDDPNDSRVLVEKQIATRQQDINIQRTYFTSNVTPSKSYQSTAIIGNARNILVENIPVSSNVPITSLRFKTTNAIETRDVQCSTSTLHTIVNEKTINLNNKNNVSEIKSQLKSVSVCNSLILRNKSNSSDTIVQNKFNMNPVIVKNIATLSVVPPRSYKTDMSVAVIATPDINKNQNSRSFASLKDKKVLDYERLQNKRFFIINRSINNTCDFPPIPLKYEQIKIKNTELNPKENMRQLSKEKKMSEPENITVDIGSQLKLSAVTAVKDNVETKEDIIENGNKKKLLSKCSSITVDQMHSVDRLKDSNVDQSNEISIINSETKSQVDLKHANKFSKTKSTSSKSNTRKAKVRYKVIKNSSLIENANTSNNQTKDNANSRRISLRLLKQKRIELDDDSLDKQDPGVKEETEMLFNDTDPKMEIDVVDNDYYVKELPDIILPIQNKDNFNEEKVITVLNDDQQKDEIATMSSCVNSKNELEEFPEVILSKEEHNRSYMTVGDTVKDTETKPNVDFQFIDVNNEIAFSNIAKETNAKISTNELKTKSKIVKHNSKELNKEMLSCLNRNTDSEKLLLRPNSIHMPTNVPAYIEKSSKRGDIHSFTTVTIDKNAKPFIRQIPVQSVDIKVSDREDECVINKDHFVDSKDNDSKILYKLNSPSTLTVDNKAKSLIEKCKECNSNTKFTTNRKAKTIQKHKFSSEFIDEVPSIVTDKHVTSDVDGTGELRRSDKTDAKKKTFLAQKSFSEPTDSTVSKKTNASASCFLSQPNTAKFSYLNNSTTDPLKINDRKTSEINYTTIILPGGRRFKATVSHNSAIDIKKFLAKPELMEMINNQLTENTQYTLNIKQSNQLNFEATLMQSSKSIEFVDLLSDDKQYTLDIKQSNQQNFEATLMQSSKSIEFVDLLSDDEDELVCDFFITEYGTYKILPLKEAIQKLHQKKFDLKCSVRIERQNAAMSMNKSKFTSYILNNNLEMVDLTQSSDEDDTTVSICDTNKENTSREAKMAECNILNNSTNPPNSTTLEDNSVTFVAETDHLSQEVITGDNVECNEVNVSSVANLDSVSNTHDDPEIKNTIECTSLKSIYVLPETDRSKILTCDEPNNILRKFDIKNCSVKIVNCDKLVSKIKNARHITKDCYIKLFRCDLAAYNIKVDAGSANETNNLFNQGFYDDFDAEDMISYSVITKTQENFSSTELSETSMTCYDHMGIYGRTSPVIEIFEMLVAYDSNVNEERTNTLKPKLVCTPENLYSLHRLKCCAEWYVTKATNSLNNKTIKFSHNIYDNTLKPKETLKRKYSELSETKPQISDNLINVNDLNYNINNNSKENSKNNSENQTDTLQTSAQSLLSIVLKVLNECNDINILDTVTKKCIRFENSAKVNRLKRKGDFSVYGYDHNKKVLKRSDKSGSKYNSMKTLQSKTVTVSFNTPTKANLMRNIDEYLLPSDEHRTTKLATFCESCNNESVKNEFNKSGIHIRQEENDKLYLNSFTKDNISQEDNKEDFSQEYNKEDFETCTVMTKEHDELRYIDVNDSDSSCQSPSLLECYQDNNESTQQLQHENTLCTLKSVTNICEQRKDDINYLDTEYNKNVADIEHATHKSIIINSNVGNVDAPDPNNTYYLSTYSDNFGSVQQLHDEENTVLSINIPEPINEEVICDYNEIYYNSDNISSTKLHEQQELHCNENVKPVVSSSDVVQDSEMENYIEIEQKKQYPMDLDNDINLESTTSKSDTINYSVPKDDVDIVKIKQLHGDVRQSHDDEHVESAALSCHIINDSEIKSDINFKQSKHNHVKVQQSHNDEHVESAAQSSLIINDFAMASDINLEQSIHCHVEVQQSHNDEHVESAASNSFIINNSEIESNIDLEQSKHSYIDIQQSYNDKCVELATCNSDVIHDCEVERDIDVEQIKQCHMDVQQSHNDGNVESATPSSRIINESELESIIKREQIEQCQVDVQQSHNDVHVESAESSSDISNDSKINMHIILEHNIFNDAEIESDIKLDDQTKHCHVKVQQSHNDEHIESAAQSSLIVNDSKLETNINLKQIKQCYGVVHQTHKDEHAESATPGSHVAIDSKIESNIHLDEIKHCHVEVQTSHDDEYVESAAPSSHIISDSEIVRDISLEQNKVCHIEVHQSQNDEYVGSALPSSHIISDSEIDSDVNLEQSKHFHMEVQQSQNNEYVESTIPSSHIISDSELKSDINLEQSKHFHVEVQQSQNDEYIESPSPSSYIINDSEIKSDISLEQNKVSHIEVQQSQNDEYVESALPSSHIISDSEIESDINLQQSKHFHVEVQQSQNDEYVESPSPSSHIINDSEIKSDISLEQNKVSHIEVQQSQNDEYVESALPSSHIISDSEIESDINLEESKHFHIEVQLSQNDGYVEPALPSSHIINDSEIESDFNYQKSKHCHMVVQQSQNDKCVKSASPSSHIIKNSEIESDSNVVQNKQYSTGKVQQSNNNCVSSDITNSNSHIIQLSDINVCSTELISDIIQNPELGNKTKSLNFDNSNVEVSESNLPLTSQLNLYNEDCRHNTFSKDAPILLRSIEYSVPNMGKCYLLVSVGGSEKEKDKLSGSNISSFENSLQIVNQDVPIDELNGNVGLDVICDSDSLHCSEKISDPVPAHKTGNSNMLLSDDSVQIVYSDEIDNFVSNEVIINVSNENDTLEAYEEETINENDSLEAYQEETIKDTNILFSDNGCQVVNKNRLVNDTTDTVDLNIINQNQPFSQRLLSVDKEIQSNTKNDESCPTILKDEEATINTNIIDQKCNTVPICSYESVSPKIKYNTDSLKLICPKRTYSSRVLKRKHDMPQNKANAKKFRKGKNIDFPKLTKTSIQSTSYNDQFKRVDNYYSSMKFSYCLSIGNRYCEIEDIEVESWPLTIKSNPNNDISIANDEFGSTLFTDIPQCEKDHNAYASLTDEISVDNLETQIPSFIEPNENTINMGFGEESGRVIINSKIKHVSKLSAATLSDVKRTQPFPTSGNYENDKQSNNSTRHSTKAHHTDTTFMNLRNKVKIFFENNKLYESAVNKAHVHTNKISPVKLCRILNNIPGLYSTEFIRPAHNEQVVQVVQVGQLPVSAAAQNAVSCDSRVSQATDTSPSQCSVDNSPHSGINDTTHTTVAKTNEYTELTTADISMPAVIRDFEDNESMPLVPQSSDAASDDQSIPSNVQESSDKDERLKENLQNHINENNTNEIVDASQTVQMNNIDFQYDNNTTSVLTSETSVQMVYASAQHTISDAFMQQKQENGSIEKNNQIANAMNAAGIATTNTRAHALVNILSQKIIRPATPGTAQTATNSYAKPTSINTMSIQQALAQILPPPLNQTSTGDNQSTPQVLHIVQGKSASGNQITLLDNSQPSVISSPNTTQVLHIVQNKCATSGATSNGSQAAPSNSFGGISLVDAGLPQGGNQLLHIVNAGHNQKNNAGQLLKRVNLLTNISNVQSGNEQKMVQFVCKSADGKAIQLNAPHQRSMVLRLQPIETPTTQTSIPKPADAQADSPTNTIVNSIISKDAIATQQEIKSRSVYEENYAKFIQTSTKQSVVISEKSTSLPKFNQAFGKPVFQDGVMTKHNEISGNNAHMPIVNNTPEGTECAERESGINLDHIGQISSPPLLLRKSPAQTSQPQSNLVQQIKQTIAPMNIQTMHGGVIYTRQIPVNIGGGQTINLITVPSTELIDDSPQKPPSDIKFVTQGDIEQSIIKIVPQTQTSNTDVNSEDNGQHGNVSNDSVTTHQQQPVLTQMRIKLPMLSKTPQGVPGTRVMRPSFFQIQRNVIGGANQPVYQQLVLTAAPSLGQQAMRLPQPQTARQIKVPSDSQSESQLSSSTLEQLREFDMVLEQVKERSTVQPGGGVNTFAKLHTSTSSDTTDSVASTAVVTAEPPQQVLYSIGGTQALNVAYVNRKPTITSSTTVGYVRSPDSSGVADSPSPQVVQSVPDSPVETQQKSTKVGSKSVKSRPSKPASTPPNSMKVTPVPPKTSAQKPLEDEQTTQRILYILAEYKEQVENSPDKDKPAPRRRSNPPSNPSGSSKRKKSSSGSRRPGGRDSSPVTSEDPGRTMGSEDSSCGTSQGDCTESCGADTHSPQDSPRKVARKLTFEPESAPATPAPAPAPQPRPQPQRNVIVADGQTIAVTRGAPGKPATAVLMPANYILPVSMMKGGQQIAIVTNRGPKLLAVGQGEGGANALLLQRLIGPAGLKPVLARPGVRHVRLPTAALHNLHAFNLTATAPSHPLESTVSPAAAPTPPDLVESRTATGSWQEQPADSKRASSAAAVAASPEGADAWRLPPGDVHDYAYDDPPVHHRGDSGDRTVLILKLQDSLPDRYSPDMEAQRIFDKMFDVGDAKKSYVVDGHDAVSSPRVGHAYDIDAAHDHCHDKAYQQVVTKKDGCGVHTVGGISAGGTLARVSHASAAALRHKYAMLEHELRLQKSLSEECEDLGVDSPSASELFPEAELLFATSPAHDHAHEHAHNAHTSQSTLLGHHGGVPQPDLDDQIATDHLLPDAGQRDDDDKPRPAEPPPPPPAPHSHLDADLELGDVGVVTVGGAALDHEEFARSHPNTTFHSEPTDDADVQPFSISGLKGRHITSAIFHAHTSAATTVLMTAPAPGPGPPPVDARAAPVKYADIDNVISSMGGAHGLTSVLVKDDGLARFDNMLGDSRELHLGAGAHTVLQAPAAAAAAQVIRRVCYDDEKPPAGRYLLDEPDALIAGDDAKISVAEDSSREATLESMGGDADDDRSSPERHAELFWESNSASERSESRRPLDSSSDSDKCCKSPSLDETNSTDSSGLGRMRLDTVIKEARRRRRSGSGDGSSADDAGHPPVRTYPPKRAYQPPEPHPERSVSGKTRAGEHTPHAPAVRRRASNRGVVKRGCHCCNGEPAAPGPSAAPAKKPRQRKLPVDD